VSSNASYFNQKLENLPNDLQNLTLGHNFNQKLENLPNNLQNLILGNYFNQKLENLPNVLQNLTLGHNFNQKLENLPNNLQNLTLGYSFNQSLNLCVALHKLQNLSLNARYNLEIPPLFNTTIIVVSGNLVPINFFYNLGILNNLLEIR